MAGRRPVRPEAIAVLARVVGSVCSGARPAALCDGVLASIPAAALMGLVATCLPPGPAVPPSAGGGGGPALILLQPGEGQACFLLSSAWLAALDARARPRFVAIHPEGGAPRVRTLLRLVRWLRWWATFLWSANQRRVCVCPTAFSLRSLTA